MHSSDWKQLIKVSIASSDHVFEFSIFIFAISPFFCFAMSCNRGKTDGKTKKSKRKCFFQQKCFWSEPKTFARFPGVSFVGKHEGNKWQYTKNLIKYCKFLFCFSHYFPVNKGLTFISMIYNFLLSSARNSEMELTIIFYEELFVDNVTG